MKSNRDLSNRIEQLLAHLFTIAFSLVSLVCFSQNLAPRSKFNPVVDDLFNGRPFMRPPSNVAGEINFNEEWRLTNATLYDEGKKIEGYFAKYNIYFNELDFSTANGIKAIEGEKIKTFTIHDSIARTFVNAKDFAKDKVLVGFLEVMVTGQFPLYKFHYVLVKNPDYNPALNSGSRDTRVYKKNSFYTISEGKLVELKGKKKLLLVFGDKASSVDQFIKENHLSINEEHDLIEIFNFFNGLK